MNRFDLYKIIRNIGMLRIAFYFLLPAFAILFAYRNVWLMGAGFILASILTVLLSVDVLIYPHERRNAVFIIISDLLMIGFSIHLFGTWDLYPLYFMPMSIAGTHFKHWVTGLVGLLGIASEILLIGTNGEVLFYILLHLGYNSVFVIILYKVLSREKQERRERKAMGVTLSQLREAHDYLKVCNKDLAHMARTDALTELYNYRFFEESLRKYVEYGQLYQNPVSLLMIDIDHFKNLNDTFGHRSGDRALKFVADTIRKNVRSEDLVCRYGGEEFAVILPWTNLDQAGELAERIRCAIRDCTRRGHGFGTITVSIGVATYSVEATGQFELVESADRALYEAKRQGRDRVIFNRILSPSS